MRDIEHRTIFFGVLIMTIIQCMYWWYLATDQVSWDVTLFFKILLLPIIFTVIYCVYEKKVLFDILLNNKEEITLAILWGGETIVGMSIASDVIYEKRAYREYLNYDVLQAFCAGFIMFAGFFVIRYILKKKIP